MYYLSYTRYLKNDKLIIFYSTAEKHSESAWNESLIKLKIDDELNIITRNMSTILMEIVVNRKH